MSEYVGRAEFEELKKQVSDVITRVAVTERDVININKKLDKIDNNTTWILRLIIGAIIMAVLGLIFI